MNFFSLGVQDRIKQDHYLIKLDKLIDWTEIEKTLKGIHVNEVNPKGGPKAYRNLSMFKAMLLGQWHSLSDPALEESLTVRLDFMVFTGFELGERVPDETTLCRFRNKLIERGLQEKLFQEVNRQLEGHGIKVKKSEGSLLDATIITSAARPRQTVESDKVSQSKDPDATWLKKGKKCYFGYRGYAIADQEKGFIDAIAVEPANKSEMTKLPELIEKVQGKRLLTDKGFSSAENRKLVKEAGIKSGLSYKASKGSPLRYSQRLFNKIVAKRRFRIEQGFGTLKRKFQMSRATYMGRIKVEAQLYWKAICFNLTKALNVVSI